MNDLLLYLLFGLPAAYMLFMHLLGPILVKRSERLPQEYRFDLIDEREYFSRRGETSIMLDYELRNLGFRYVGSSVLRNTNTDAFFSLYSKEDEALSAMLTTLCGPLGDMGYVEFSRLHEDGSTLEINNAAIPALFPKRPEKLQLRYPELESVHELYQATRQLIAYVPNSARPRPLPAGKEFATVEQLMNDEVNILLDGGYYQRSAVDGFHPISVKGAILFSWKSLWPWQWLRRKLEEHQSLKLLKQADGD